MASGGIVCCLLYGEYPEMHAQFCAGIAAIRPDVPVFMGLNAIGPKSMQQVSKITGIPATAPTVDGHAEYGRYRVFTRRNVNRLKYPVMRDMYSQAGDRWTFWVDDDVMLPTTPGWWNCLCGIMARGIDYVGAEYYCGYAGNQAAFIKQRPWYRGLPPVVKNGRPTFVFHLGAFHALSARARVALDWPDPLLRHRGGDTLLGEAIRQHGFKKEQFPFKAYPIRVNGPRRRGHDEAPLGVKS